jgi:hypothetical protein
MYFPTLVFSCFSKVTKLKVLCVKAFCHDAKSAYPGRDECTTVSIPKVESGILD